MEEVCPVAIDGFAGGGGASTGIEMALGYSPDVAINHDREALAMHRPTIRRRATSARTSRHVNFKRVMRGKPVGGAWFSPDCTYHSKARGGKPFRDRNKARRIRGLAWEMVRCAIQVRPRVLFMENVEEIEFWGPLDKRACRSPRSAARAGGGSSRGCATSATSCEWRRWSRRDTARRRRARGCSSSRGATASRSSGRRTHGPGLKPYRTAAECIDFSLPVPSIFLTASAGEGVGQGARRADAEAPARGGDEAADRARDHAVRHRRAGAVHHRGTTASTGRSHGQR
jgi:DNA (cytosine-5)-methyltransferase 1